MTKKKLKGKEKVVTVTVTKEICKWEQFIIVIFKCLRNTKYQLNFQNNLFLTRIMIKELEF